MLVRLSSVLRSFQKPINLSHKSLCLHIPSNCLCSTARTFDLEIKCFTRVMEFAEPKNAVSIRKQFDQFEDTLSGQGHEYMYNTNSGTADILLKLVKERKPKKFLELGN